MLTAAVYQDVTFMSSEDASKSSAKFFARKLLMNSKKANKKL